MIDHHTQQRQAWLSGLPRETLQERNASRVASAIEKMGEKHLLHPKNRVQRITHAPLRGWTAADISRNGDHTSAAANREA